MGHTQTEYSFVYNSQGCTVHHLANLGKISPEVLNRPINWIFSITIFSAKCWPILSKICLIADYLFKLAACTFCLIKSILIPKSKDSFPPKDKPKHQPASIWQNYRKSPIGSQYIKPLLFWTYHFDRWNPLKSTRGTSKKIAATK